MVFLNLPFLSTVFLAIRCLLLQLPAITGSNVFFFLLFPPLNSRAFPVLLYYLDDDATWEVSPSAFACHSGYTRRLPTNPDSFSLLFFPSPSV